MDTSSEDRFAPGTEVRYRRESARVRDVKIDRQTRVRKIIYYGDRHVIYSRDGEEQHMSRGMFDEEFEPVPNFFEEGKTYFVRPTDNTWERFKVEAVRTASGKLFAFGYLVSSDMPPTWVIMANFSWENRGWEETQ